MRLPTIALLVFVAAVAAHAQVDYGLNGTVVDSHGAPISGARVSCEGNSRAVLTDDSGKFAIICGSGRITVSAIGFATISVTPAGRDSTIPLQPTPFAARVTVMRVATDLADTPASTVALDRRDLEASGSLTLDDRLRQVPGFTLFRRAGSSTANPTTQGVSLRGVGASGASRALVLDDGVPLNDPFGGWIYWGRVPEESISSVELVRGPASDLYGSSAVGGVVSIADRQSSDSPFAEIDLAYGSERSPLGSVFGGLGNERVRTSLGAELYRTDGFIPTAPEARGPVDTLANVSRYGFAPRFEYRRSSRTLAFARLGLYQERRKNGSPLQNNDTRIADVTLGIDTATHDFGTFSARLYGLTEKYHQSFTAIAANRQTESLNRLQTVPSQAVGASGQWTAELKKHVVFAGADIRQVRGRSDETAVSNGIATSLSTSGGRETTFGSFAGGVLDWKRIILSGGVRYDAWWNARGYSATHLLINGTSTLTRFTDRSESRVSPRISVLGRITPHVSITGLFSTAFRQPTLNELYRSFRVGNVLTLGNDTLTAERATSAEAALVVNGLGQRL